MCIRDSAGTDITLDTRDDVSAHEKDALCGALAFSRICPASDGLPSDLHDEPAISLIGLHLLESGLSSDMRLLSETCTVLKAVSYTHLDVYKRQQWGRRWVTCDTSRMPLAPGRQRLLTDTFPHYELRDAARSPKGEFAYQ